MYTTVHYCCAGGKEYVVQKAHSMSTCLALLFCWLNHLPVTAAAEAVGCGRLTTVNHYSMTREVCEVIMSNEVLDRKFGSDEK